MAAPPYMQVWIADWTADVQHLSCEQDGAYWRLIRAMWRNHGSLQNDARKLAHIAGLSPKKWAAICDDVLAFFEVDGDFLRHGKLTETLISVSQKSAERSAAGAKGGAAKALKTKEPALANATVLPEQTPSISDFRDHKERESKEDSLPAAPKAPDRFSEFWKIFPRKIAKPAAHKAYLKALKETDHETLVAGLNHQISWGVFDEPRYSPHAATWLNAGRWSDERDASGKGMAAGSNPRTGGRRSGGLVGAVARSQSADRARMEVPGGEGGLFGDDRDWSNGAIEGEFRPGDPEG